MNLLRKKNKFPNSLSHVADQWRRRCLIESTIVRPMNDRRPCRKGFSWRVFEYSRDFDRYLLSLTGWRFRWDIFADTKKTKQEKSTARIVVNRMLNDLSPLDSTVLYGRKGSYIKYLCLINRIDKTLWKRNSLHVWIWAERRRVIDNAFGHKNCCEEWISRLWLCCFEFLFGWSTSAEPCKYVLTRTAIS